MFFGDLSKNISENKTFILDLDSAKATFSVTKRRTCSGDIAKMKTIRNVKRISKNVADANNNKYRGHGFVSDFGAESIKQDKHRFYVFKTDFKASTEK